MYTRELGGKAGNFSPHGCLAFQAACFLQFHLLPAEALETQTEGAAAGGLQKCVGFLLLWPAQILRRQPKSMGSKPDTGSNVGLEVWPR